MSDMSYGKKWGSDLAVEVPLAASQVFKYKSGKFLVKNGDGNYEIADSGDTEIAGWAMINGEFTSNSTAATDKVAMNISLDAVFEIPADATFTAAELKAMRMKTCDLIVASNIQKADIGESNEDVIQIIDGDVDSQTLFVRINPNKLGTTGVV